MFPDIGSVELVIVAIVALLVVKPKDLPVMMRKIGEFMNKARRMASDFRASFDDMARQSELEELRKEVEAMRAKASDPMGINAALQETNTDIQESLGDFSVGGYASNQVDAPADWDDPSLTAAPSAEPAPKPKRKAASRKTAMKATVEGGAAPSDIVTPARRKRTKAT